MSMKSYIAVKSCFAVLLTLTITETMQARPPELESKCVSDNYVTSCFEYHGDDFWVYDGEKDGRSAVVIWWTSYGRTGTCRNKKGYGTWHECKYDMKEGETVYWDHFTYDAETDDFNYISGTYECPISGFGVPI